jgi:hypothetical protein
VSSVATSLSSRFYSRTAILIAFLLLELALAWSFRALAWFETGGVIRWGACALLALAPLVVAADAADCHVAVGNLHVGERPAVVRGD